MVGWSHVSRGWHRCPLARAPSTQGGAGAGSRLQAAAVLSRRWQALYARARVINLDAGGGSSALRLRQLRACTKEAGRGKGLNLVRAMMRMVSVSFRVGSK
jgi:hypothetical protein